MVKRKRTSKLGRSKKMLSKSRRKRDIQPEQTDQPFEQDAKRRIGHFSGTGEPPLMKK